MPDETLVRHVPVLAEEAIALLVHRRDGVYLDATLGDGGHAERILALLEGSGRLIGVDRDPKAHAVAQVRLAAWSRRVTYVETPFARIELALEALSVPTISGALFDLGVSSGQIDEPERGFSFRYSGPLDMRMGPDAATRAATIVNEWSEDALARVLSEYGEEPRARQIARTIVRERDGGKIETTDHLARILGRRGKERPEKTLARVFQALRIAVNGELDQIEPGLDAVLDRLEPGGRIVVIAYHSLEDRIVKRWMRREATDCICPPGTPVCTCGHRARVRLLTRRVVVPSEAECAENRRARSARMRAVERLPER